MALRNRRLAQLALFAVLSAAHTWPLASALSTLSRMDNADTALNAWILSWVAHQLPLAPLRLFDANIFYPEPRTLAFSEHMVVQGVMSAPFFALGWSAVTVYNVMLLLGFTLSGWAMAVVVERWTGSVSAGLVAGMAYAFNAHTLVRLGHMQALHVQFLPLALAALQDLLERRPTWTATARLVLATAAQCLTANYLLVMTGIAMAAAAVSQPRAWFGRDGWRRVGYVGAAALVTGLVLAPFLLPYYRAKQAQGLVRTYDEVEFYSGQLRYWFATGGRLHYALWSHTWFEGSTPLFPGLTVLLLAGMAVVQRETWRTAWARALIAIAIAGAVFSFGAKVPVYHWLYDHVPILQGIRAPSRLGWLTLFALAPLAGLGLAQAQRRWPLHATALALAAALAVNVEAARTPMGFTTFAGIPAIYRHVAALRDPVLIEVPFPSTSTVQDNGPYVLASTTHFQPMLNGYSGFLPRTYGVHASVALRLPTAAAIDELGYLDVTHMVVHGRRTGREFIALLEETGRLRLVAREGDDRLYALVRAPRASP